MVGEHRGILRTHVFRIFGNFANHILKIHPVGAKPHPVLVVVGGLLHLPLGSVGHRLRIGGVYVQLIFGHNIEMVPKLVPEVVVVPTDLSAVLLGIDHIAHDAHNRIRGLRALLPILNFHTFLDKLLDISSVFPDYKLITLGIVFNHRPFLRFQNKVAKIHFFGYGGHNSENASTVGAVVSLFSLAFEDNQHRVDENLDIHQE